LFSGTGKTSHQWQQVDRIICGGGAKQLRRRRWATAAVGSSGHTSATLCVEQLAVQLR